MDEDRSNRAFARIEQALARIEAGSRRPPPVADDAEMAALRARHDRLRLAVQGSLEQLDQLIEGTQG
jgi:hypothetical protein